MIYQHFALFVLYFLYLFIIQLYTEFLFFFARLFTWLVIYQSQALITNLNAKVVLFISGVGWWRWMSVVWKKNEMITKAFIYSTFVGKRNDFYMAIRCEDLSRPLSHLINVHNKRGSFRYSYYWIGSMKGRLFLALLEMDNFSFKTKQCR